jgi:subtilisin-like proprotein convertase family protein
MATLRLATRIAGLGLMCAAISAGLASPAGAATFSGGPITINDFTCDVQAAATPYPSQIAVAGMAGTVTDVNVTLTNLTHSAPDDLRMLLVGPAGQTTSLFEFASDDDVATDVTFTLDDEASGPIPHNALVSGTYRPTQTDAGDCEHFRPLPAPAPAGPYGAALSAFDGVSATGAWKLYIVDDDAVDDGDVEGWSIAITTTGTAQTTFSNTNPITIADKDEGEGCPAVPATPYPASIDVIGLTAPVTDVNLTLTNFTHTFPADVRILLVGPTGQTALLMEDAGSGDDASDVTFTLDDEAAGPIPNDPLVAGGTYQPTVNADGCGDPYPSMPPPAPAAPYGAALSAFDGTNPTGTWRLYVVDQHEDDAGDIEGWSLDITTAPSFASSVLADSPAGYWRFGEASGTTLLDSSGLGNNGTYLGGVTLGQPGALAVDPNTAALYDGINDQGRVPDSNSLDVGNSFTAEGWVKRSSAAQSHELMNKGAGGIQLMVMSAASQNRVLLRRAGVASVAQSTSGVPADGRFHHVVATMNGLGSTARIYIDGADVTQGLAPGQTILNTAFPLTFGSFGSAPSQPATYDEFALYDAALSPARVQAHHSAGAP